jgi:hypothetical protein
LSNHSCDNMPINMTMTSPHISARIQTSKRGAYKNHAPGLSARKAMMAYPPAGMRRTSRRIGFGGKGGMSSSWKYPASCSLRYNTWNECPCRWTTKELKQERAEREGEYKDGPRYLHY